MKQGAYFRFSIFLFIFYLVLVLYDANNTKSKMFKRIKKTHVQSILVLHIYSGENHIPGTMVCEQLLFFLLCSPGKKKKKAQNPSPEEVNRD